MTGGTTARLILRPLALADAPALQRLFPRWEIVRYLPKDVPWPYPPDGALQFCRDVVLPQVERSEAWHWTLRLRTQPEALIGHIHLVRGEENNRGFWIDPLWQRQGLITEACVWTNNYWFETLGFPILRVYKAAENLASHRVSQKQGMRLIGKTEKEYLSGRLPTEIWEITTEEWRTWKMRNLPGA